MSHTHTNNNNCLKKVCLLSMFILLFHSVYSVILLLQYIILIGFFLVENLNLIKEIKTIMSTSKNKTKNIDIGSIRMAVKFISQIIICHSAILLLLLYEYINTEMEFRKKYLFTATWLPILFFHSFIHSILFVHKFQRHYCKWWQLSDLKFFFLIRSGRRRNSFFAFQFLYCSHRFAFCTDSNPVV